MTRSVVMITNIFARFAKIGEEGARPALSRMCVGDSSVVA